MIYSRYEKILYYFVAISLVVFAIFPIYWTLISSLKIPSELINREPTYFPQTITLEYYQNIWDVEVYLEKLYEKKNEGGQIRPEGFLPKGMNVIVLNSVYVSIGTIILTAFLSTFTGYAFAVFEFPFKKIIYIIILLPIFIPVIVLVIPLYSLLKDLNLINSYYSLILIHSISLLPLGTFMMRNAFQSVPESLKEIAILEGSSEIRIIFNVMLPLALPGLLTVMVFAMWVSWGDFMMAFIFTTKAEMTSLNVALTNLARTGIANEIRWGNLMAGSMVSFIPIILFYVFMQKYFVRGITASAVKE